MQIAIPLVAAAVLLGGGIFAASRFGSEPTTTAGPTREPSVAATESTAPPTSPSTSSPTKSPSSKPTKAASTVGQKQLTSCRRKVDAADRVLAAGRTGVLHWATHVQAQTDANRGRIGLATMKERFAKSRAAGPADQSRYAKAKSQYADLNGSCAKVKGASASIAGKLADCRDRAEAQKPVLAAADDGMADWKNHLAAMQRSREGHVPNAQGIWLRAWRAAPPNINAYKKAYANFDAPKC